MRKKPSSKTISFRIDSRLAAKLTKKALNERVSVHEYVRIIFLDALAQIELRSEIFELREDIENVAAEIDDLRHDLSILLFKFLVELTDIDEEDAENWITKNLAASPHKVNDREESP